MPNRDGKGPLGTGPMGRRAGWCRWHAGNTTVETEQAEQFAGPRRGRLEQQGRGTTGRRGNCRGNGMGRGGRG
ncbi:hypothetical protein [Desulfobulbus elongatus]|uniref:hypothetical protein n=1 Tax=Desulfobulbus elongatus TaxID=53332 RepID=UPI001B805A49|nr:hypothetical protein [Desulfobulbus elongatus]